MSDTFFASLLVQVVTVMLLRVRLGTGWLRRPVTWVVLASVVNQAIGPLLLAIPSVGAVPVLAVTVKAIATVRGRNRARQAAHRHLTSRMYLSARLVGRGLAAPMTEDDG